MGEELIYLNGIDGITGNYLVPPMSAADVVAAARGKPQDAKLVRWLRSIRDVLLSPLVGLPLDIDPTDITRAGWGIVFPKDAPQAMRDALKPLITHRRQHVSPDRCKVLEYRAGETRDVWLKRYGVYTGSVEPKRVPYYLLLAGEPAEIPFEFQYPLDIEYAVGRLAFESAEQYRQYAQSVVEYETASAVPNAREVLYWGPRHAADPATQMSADHLITSLYLGVPASGDQEQQAAIAAALGYRSQCLKGRDATKANLAEVLHPRGRSARPALLFTASHGMGWPRGHKEQRPAQGALLCQDWTGRGSVRPSHYLSAGDIADDARVHGLVAFHFACFGAGTPAFDNFLTDRDRGPARIAEQPFIAALPERLLSHPQGSALAVIGHVERAWGYSIMPPGVGPQLVPFHNCIERILRGEPVGHATKDFSEKYAALSATLADLLDETRPGPRPKDEEVAWSWIERNDAQNYVLLGDPAVRLRVDRLT
jgi:hypothetical protein